MRHWTEVLFVSCANVSIGLLAGVPTPGKLVHCHYLAFLIIQSTSIDNDIDADATW